MERKEERLRAVERRLNGIRENVFVICPRLLKSRSRQQQMLHEGIRSTCAGLIVGFSKTN
jgi:hypothetical protein